MTTLYLASSSKRRSDLLRKFKIDFTLIDNKLLYEPEYDNQSTTSEYVETLALNKNISSRQNYAGLILTADTIVNIEDKVLGKPKDRNEAFEMLRLLSGQTHHVISAICLYDTNTEKTHLISESANVSFKTLAEEDISSYIDTNYVFDKAGSYHILTAKDCLVSNFTGELDTIMGLPMKSLLEILKQYITV